MEFSPGGDGRAERRKLDAIEMSEVAGERGQVEMRIAAGVAVPWKMFCSGDSAVLFDAADKRSDKFRDPLRVFAEGSRVNDWIIRIAVDVRIGREDPRHAHSFRF